MSITTRVAGNSARISRHASIPEPSGRRTSITTRSGWKRLAISIDFGDRAGLGDDLELRSAVEHGDQTLADDLVVVDHQEGQRSARAISHGVAVSSSASGPWGGRWISIRVPVASLSMSMVAPTVATRERILARPWWPGLPTARRIEPAPVVLDPEPQAPVRSRADPDLRARGARVAGDVGQGLVRDAQEIRCRRRVGLDVHRSDMQLDIDDRVVAELLHDRGQPGHQGRPAQELRPQAEDEVPDVPDRQVEAVDRPLDASLDLVRIIAQELRDVLEGKADRVDVLDDAVVEVLADALALVDDRQALDLLVQLCVLDGDAGVDGERLDQALIGSENSAAPALSVR